VVAGGVRKKRLKTGGCVVGAGGVAKKREGSSGRILIPAIVEFKCSCSHSCVLCTAGVKQKRCSADGRI
jgi:hypothetical protein